MATENMAMEAFEVLGSLASISTVGGIAVWECAKARFIITFLARNRVAVAEIEGEPLRLLANLPPGLTLNGTVIEGEPTNKTTIDSKKKFHYIGLPWVKIREFKLLHERMNTEISDATPVPKWIEKDPEMDDEWFLLVDVLHEFLFMGLKLKTGFRVNMLIQLQLLLRKPLVTFYNRMGVDEDGNNIAKFYEEISTIAAASIENALQKMAYNIDENLPSDKQAQQQKEHLAFLSEAKNSETDWTKNICIEINQTLADLTGYQARKLLIPKWDLATTAEQELQRKRIEAEIEKVAQEIKAAGEVAELAAVMKAIKEAYPNVSERERMAMAKDYMKTKNIAESDLQYYSENGGGIPIAPQQPRGNKNRKGGYRK